jgi:hypothetical protein
MEREKEEVGVAYFKDVYTCIDLKELMNSALADT